MNKSLKQKVEEYQSKIERIEGMFEIWGFYVNGKKTHERKLVIPFNQRYTR